MSFKNILQWLSPLGAFITGGALLLILHTHGHLIEFTFLRYLLIWVPIIVLTAMFPYRDVSLPMPKTALASAEPSASRLGEAASGGAWVAARQSAATRLGEAFSPRWSLWRSPGGEARAARRRLAKPGLSAAILLVFLVLYLFSSSTDYPWFYFLSWLPRKTFSFYIFQSQLGQFVLLTALLAPILMFRPGKLSPWLLAVLLFTIAGSAYVFIRETGGAFLYYDDHPSTLFRLWEFCSTFPRQVNYNPYWNGGLVSNHPALTGTSAFGVFLLPFWKFIPIEQCYTPLIAVVFIGVVPLMALFSMRIIGANWLAAFCAGILALGISQFYFLWLLFYGTVGAVFSAAGFMPVSACLFRALFLNRREKWVGVVLIIGACLMLAWPPNAVLAAVLLVVLLLNIRQISKVNIFFLVVCGAAILLIQWPQIVVILKEMLQGYYETAGAPAASGSVQFSRVFFNGYGKLVDYIRMGHPVLIFLGLGGVITVVSPDIRRWFLPLILFLLLITGWGPEVMPGFQLFRMVIPLFFVAVIPASLAVNELLSFTEPKLALLRSAIIALLIVGAANTIMLFGNGLRAPYETLSRDGHDMTEWIRSNAPEGTRVLFAGSTVHGYEGGHVAFLQYLTGREMMACDYYHFSPAAVEYNYPPQSWRKNMELFSRFLELYNVSVVTTLRNDWKGYLRSRPAEYREVKWFGEKKYLTFFKVIRPPPSLLLIGEGRVQADFNRFDVELTGTNEQAVIKYNWQPGLVADNPSEIFPYHAGPGIRFIGINSQGQKHVVVRYKNWL